MEYPKKEATCAWATIGIANISWLFVCDRFPIAPRLIYAWVMSPRRTPADSSLLVTQSSLSSSRCMSDFRRGWTEISIANSDERRGMRRV